MYEEDPMKLSFYELEGKIYFIRDGEVYTNDESGAPVRVDMLPSSLQMYADCTDHSMYELFVTEIKILENNMALISANDGAGIEISFLERDYKENKSKYETGKKGIYQISAELESIEIPEDKEDGVNLEGENARKFFDWVEDEVEENAVATVGFKDMVLYEKCSDFAQTGKYSFYGIVNSVCVRSVSEEIDEPDFEKTAGFDIALMDQYRRKSPRFIRAEFQGASYFEGEVQEGWAVKGILKFIAGNGITNNVYEYDSNPVVIPQEKDLPSYSDEDYTEDEDGNRWIEDE